MYVCVSGVLTYFELAIAMWLSFLYLSDFPRTEFFVRPVEYGSFDKIVIHCSCVFELKQ